MEGLTMEIKLTELDTFKNLINVMADFSQDERISADLRKEYVNKLDIALTYCGLNGTHNHCIPIFKDGGCKNCEHNKNISFDKLVSELATDKSKI